MWGTKVPHHLDPLEDCASRPRTSRLAATERRCHSAGASGIDSGEISGVGHDDSLNECCRRIYPPHIENIGNDHRARDKAERGEDHEILSSLLISSTNIMTYKFDPANDVAELAGKVAIVTGGK